MALGMGGCTAVGLIADKMAGAPKVDAEFVPPKEVMLVLVESYQNPSSVSVAAEQLDRQIVNQLLEHKVAPVVNPDRLSELRHGNPDKFGQMDIAAMGRSFGAKQVLYIDMETFSLELAIGGQMIKAHAEARVRVVDAATGRTRWPQESKAGYPVSLQTPYIALKPGTTEATVKDQITHTLAEHISRLFFSYEVDESESDPQLGNL
jgi:hypothetical protein